MRVLALIGLSVLASGAGQLFLRAGAVEAGAGLSRDSLSLASWLPLLASWKVVAGVALWALSTAVYLVVLSRAELSFAFCLGSLNYVAVPLAARWIFAEQVSGLRLAGMAVIFAGVALTLAARALEARGAGG
jgi:hypothetical protein